LKYIFAHFFLKSALEITVQAELSVLDLGPDPGFRVLAHPLLEKVGLALQRDQLHPVKGVLGVVDLVAPKFVRQSVGHELNVGTHERRVHADEFDGQRFGHERFLDAHRVLDDFADPALVELFGVHLVQQARKVAVQSLVATDEFVRER